MNATAGAPADVRSAWSPLRGALFRALWLAAVVSNVGYWMHEVGASWLMTTLAPTPLMVALVQTATTLPVVLFVLPAGVLSDIVDRRRYLVGVQLWLLLVSATLGVLTYAGHTNAWTLLAFTFALGIGSALMMPAWAAIIPEVVSSDDLQSAVALNSVGINISRAIGPALGGVVVAAAGPWAVFLLNAASFIGVIAVLTRWKRTPPTHHLPPEHFAGAFRAGVRYAMNAPVLQTVLVRGTAFFVFASATWALLPLLVSSGLGRGSDVYGALLGCIGIGAVTGAFLLPRLRARHSRDRLVAAATIVYAGAALALAHTNAIPAAAIAMLATGAAWITILSSLQISAQLALPSWVRARGLAVFIGIFMGSMAVGSMLWGFMAQQSGIPSALTLAAIGAIAGVLTTTRWKLSAADGADLAPSMHWLAPLINGDVASDRGPVMVTIEYAVDPDKVAPFLAAIVVLRRARRRDGAFFWRLFQSPAEPSRYVECFMVESWLEHLRQHDRITLADRALQDRVASLLVHGTAPRVSHLLAAETSAVQPLLRLD